MRCESESRPRRVRLRRSSPSRKSSKTAVERAVLRSVDTRADQGHAEVPRGGLHGEAPSVSFRRREGVHVPQPDLADSRTRTSGPVAGSSNAASRMRRRKRTGTGGVGSKSADRHDAFVIPVVRPRVVVLRELPVEFF